VSFSVYPAVAVQTHLLELATPQICGCMCVIGGACVLFAYVVTGVLLFENPRKWQKCKLVSGDRLRGQQLGWAMNWVDRFRTSADEQMLSGLRTVMMV